jgi:hypothetical protein
VYHSFIFIRRAQYIAQEANLPAGRSWYRGNQAGRCRTLKKLRSKSNEDAAGQDTLSVPASQRWNA